jgi:parvulin-like peptidyl-prolyl isomerase
MKFLRLPLVQFVLVGIGIYLIYAFVARQNEEQDDTTIVVSAQQVALMEANWQKRWMRAPTPEELDGQIKQTVQESMLYREAVAMGLDKNDPVIRRQLAMKLERLVQELVSGVEPTEEELKAYFETHKADYLDPERITLTQIFFDPDKRGDATLTDAETLKLKLQSMSNPAEDGKDLGDSFMLQSYFPGRTQMEIAKVLGGGFAESVFKLSEGEWHGPVLSGYGAHLVYLHGRLKAQPPEFDPIRDRVLVDYMTQKRIDARDLFIEGLFEKYEVVIEE